MAKELIEMAAEERAEFEAFRKRKAAREQREQRKRDRAAFKDLSEEFVNANINHLIMHQDATEVVIQQLKADVYGNKIEGQDSHTSTLSDGSASIKVGYNVSISFDGTESEGVKKIRDFITSLSDDSEKVQKLTKMVNTFLKPNAKTGMLNPVKIIELSKLRDEFNNEQFNDGLDIIFNAQVRNRNSMYISGWKYIEEQGKPPRKVEFRFTM